MPFPTGHLPSSPFVSDNGALRTWSLFYENTYGRKEDQSIYSLNDNDVTSPSGKHFPSLYRLYMEAEDPTEYQFAIDNLHSFQHWELICSRPWFKPYLIRWRRELDLKIKSRVLKIINEEAQDKSSKNRYSAAKILLDKTWDTTKNAVGRPPKQEEPPEVLDTSEDFTRLQSLLNKE